MGADIGVWEMRGGIRGFLLEDDTTKRGENTTLAILDAMPALSRDLAAKLSGQSMSSASKLVAVGVGALGSQVLLNLIRSGYGVWTLIDDDLLLPHNAARHALPSMFVGQSKAEAVALMGSTILADGESTAIVANVLSPRGETCRIAQAFAEAEAIIDMSASLPVARYLASDLTVGGRRVSSFLNPSGDSVAILAEDRDRRCRLDGLEMQLYRMLLSEPGMDGYMADAAGRIRPGMSCREVTSTIPQDTVATLSGIASRAVKESIRNPEALISVWRLSDSMEVTRFHTVAHRLVTRATGGWHVITDKGLIKQLCELRQASLPNETGGVLLGQFDTSRRVVYVFDMLAAPPDSEQWPSSYIRGSEGLRAQVDATLRISGGMAQYVGEWHSHPVGSSTLPSAPDMNVLRWVSAQQALDGHPGVIVIVGDGQRLSIRVLDGSEEAA